MPTETKASDVGPCDCAPGATHAKRNCPFKAGGYPGPQSAPATGGGNMAGFSFLDTAEDLVWLHEVHGVDVTGVVAAEVHGNEDCPRRVCTYARNDYREPPVVWERDDTGTLRRR